eukprot:m.407417 g.407417  ORF g.407417 m.407417 type:complete len:286 (+) comp21225_c0_seq8:253-1110(+)
MFIIHRAKLFNACAKVCKVVRTLVCKVVLPRVNICRSPTRCTMSKVLKPWCHEPITIIDQAKDAILMFHVGSGPPSNSSASSFLHYSRNQNPYGPWIPSPTQPDRCETPGPAFHPNGTLFVVCNKFQLLSTNDWETSKWDTVIDMGHPTDDPDRHWEDPFLWIDWRGNFHVLYHVYCLLPYRYGKECYSGHAFSNDGISWKFSAIEPYNGTIFFPRGGNMTFSTRERPHLLFVDKTRHTPKGVITAVSSQPVGPSCNSCVQQACSQCKITPGRDWTYTHLQLFRT